MRFAVVDPEGRVKRRGECHEQDFDHQAVWPGETVVWLAAYVGNPDQMIWDFATSQFIQPET